MLTPACRLILFLTAASAETATAEAASATEGRRASKAIGSGLRSSPGLGRPHRRLDGTGNEPRQINGLRHGNIIAAHRLAVNVGIDFLELRSHLVGNAESVANVR